jgi:G:T-mismatch repair DNA endonuclease (very short patch repair protein)
MIISRADAKAQGLKHYFTGDPCPRGHIDYRFTSVGTCAACGRERAMEKHVHTTERRRAYSDQASFMRFVSGLGRGFDYSKAQYRGAKVPLEIVCAVHGSFWQSPTNHASGKGCPKCRNAATSKRCKKTGEGFVQDAQAVWGEQFDYSLVEYMGAHTPVKIICRIHGCVEQSPTNHLQGQNPCTKCNHMKSAPEDAVAAFLSTFTAVERRNRALIAPKEVDIYLPEQKIAIEFCGMYWHSHSDREDEKKNKLRHAEKHQLCAAQGVRLITIYETEWAERPATVKRLLRNAIGKTKGRLMARKCELRKPTVQEARAFYGKYHPQGGDGTGSHYGLYWKGTLVACMRFTFGSNDRGAGAKERQWTLSRYASRVSVAGAASRLFKAFLADEKPDEVKSFSDNRLFSGGMYEQLGFQLEADVQPDYQVWSQKLGLRPKPHYQRRLLPTRLRDHGVDETFDPATDKRTEAEMTYLMGARRIYDCGKKRWVWKRG